VGSFAVEDNGGQSMRQCYRLTTSKRKQSSMETAARLRIFESIGQVMERA